MVTYSNVKYQPVKAGDKFNPEALVGSLNKRDEFRSLDSRKSGDLEKIAGEYIFPSLLEMSKEAQQATLKGYADTMEDSLGDYVVSNLGDVVKYTGNQVGAQIALNMPYKKRKASDGSELSDKDAKYNTVVETVEKIRKTAKDLETEEGQVKTLEGILKPLDDFTKRALLRYRKPEDLIKERIEDLQREAISGIVSYGVVDYMKDSLKLSESVEKEFKAKYDPKEREVQLKMKNEVDEIARKTGIAATPYQVMKIQEKYTPKLTKIQEEYAPYMDARQALLRNMDGKDSTPILLRATQQRYEQEQALKKAKEEAKKAAKEKK